MSPGYRHTAPHVTMWRDLWVQLDTGDGRRGATCSVGNTHHRTGLEGAVRAYRTVRILLNRFCTGISFKKATMSVVKKEEDGGSEGDGSPAPEPKRLRVSPSPPRWSNAKGQQSPCHNPFHAHPVFASVSTPLYLMFGPHERDILS